MYDPEIDFGVWSENYIKNVSDIVKEIWENHKYNVEFVVAQELLEHKHPGVCHIEIFLTDGEKVIYKDWANNENFAKSVGNAVEHFTDHLIKHRDEEFESLVEKPNRKNEYKALKGGYGRDRIRKWREEVGGPVKCYWCHCEKTYAELTRIRDCDVYECAKCSEEKSKEKKK